MIAPPGPAHTVDFEFHLIEWRIMAKNFPWRRLAHLAAPYRGQVIVVALLAALATAAELVEPLIYRIAISDVSGVFVQRAANQARGDSLQPGSPLTTVPKERPTSCSEVLDKTSGVRSSRVICIFDHLVVLIDQTVDSEDKLIAISREPPAVSSWCGDCYSTKRLLNGSAT